MIEKSLDRECGVKGLDFINEELRRAQRYAEESGDRGNPFIGLVTHFSGRLLRHPELHLAYVDGQRVDGGSYASQRIAVVTIARHVSAEQCACLALYRFTETTRYRDLLAIGWCRPGQEPSILWKQSNGRFTYRYARDMVREDALMTVGHPAIVRDKDYPTAFAPVLCAYVTEAAGRAILDAQGRDVRDTPCHELPPFPLYLAENIPAAQELFRRSSVPAALLGV